VAAQRYWLELMPNAPLVRDPKRRAAYFFSHFRLDDPASRHWWALAGDRRVGFAKVDMHADAEHDRLWAQVRDFFVEPGELRRGLGRAFAHAIVDHLRDQVVGQIDLNVREDNPRALAFWKSCGFDLALYRLRAYL